MSDFLLQKSCKLLKNKSLKKTRKSELQRLQKRKNYIIKKNLEEEESERNISQNLQKLQQFNAGISVGISQKDFLKHDDTDCQSSLEIEEPTVFTDKDFEEFEKLYCDT